MPSPDFHPDFPTMPASQLPLGYDGMPFTPPTLAYPAENAGGVDRPRQTAAPGVSPPEQRPIIKDGPKEGPAERPTVQADRPEMPDVAEAKSADPGLPRYQQSPEQRLAAEVERRAIHSVCVAEVKPVVDRVIDLVGNQRKLWNAEHGSKGTEKLNCDPATVVVTAAREAADTENDTRLTTVVDGVRKSNLDPDDKATVYAFGSAVGNKRATSALLSALGHERAEVDKDHRRDFAMPSDSPRLQTAITAYEERGRSSEEIIRVFGVGKEQQWALTMNRLTQSAEYQDRHNEPELAAANRQLASMNALRLITGGMAPEFVRAHTAQAMAATANSLDRLQLANNYVQSYHQISDYDLRRSSDKIFTGLMDTALATIRDPEIGARAIGLFDAVIGAHPSNYDYTKATLVLPWQAQIDRVNGKSAQRIIDNLYDSIHRLTDGHYQVGLYGPDSLCYSAAKKALNLCAQDMASAGDFAGAGLFLAGLAAEYEGWDRRELQTAFATCLDRATTSDQINALKPGVFTDDEGVTGLQAKAALAIATKDARGICWVATNLAGVVASQPRESRHRTRREPMSPAEVTAINTYNAVSKMGDTSLRLGLAQDMLARMREARGSNVQDSHLAGSLSRILIRNGDAAEANREYISATQSQLNPQDRLMRLWALARMLG